MWIESLGTSHAAGVVGRPWVAQEVVNSSWKTVRSAVVLNEGSSTLMDHFAEELRDAAWCGRRGRLGESPTRR